MIKFVKVLPAVAHISNMLAMSRKCDAFKFYLHINRFKVPVASDYYFNRQFLLPEHLLDLEQP